MGRQKEEGKEGMVKEIPDSRSVVPCLLSPPSLADVSRYFNQRQVPVAAGHSGGENARCSVPESGPRGRSLKDLSTQPERSEVRLDAYRCRE